MNSEERHHLHEHELGKLAVKTQSFLEQHGKTVAIAFVAALVVIIGGGWWYMSAASSQAEHWTELAAAGTSEEFGAVADKLKGTAPGYWARLREGELVLDESLPKMFTDREAGLADMKRCQEAFQEVLDGNPPDAIKERALFGLARVLETTSDGDTEPALKVWKRLVAEYPAGLYKAYSEERIKVLESNDGKAFYAWFAKQKPKPPEFRRPTDGAAGAAGMGLDSFLPPSPAAKPATETKAEQEPEAPAPDKKIPDEAPAEKPAEEKPAAEKPAEEKPADEKPADKPE